MRFGQVPPCAQRGRLIAKERRKRRVRAERGIEIGFALHGVLSDLVEMPTHPSHLQGELVLVNLLVASFTQRQQIGQRIFAAVFSIHQMVRLQANVVFPAVLTGIAVAHQAGDTQVLIQPPRILILTPFERGSIQPRDIHLDIFDDDLADGQRKPLDDADHLFDIGFDARRESPTARASSSVGKACRAIPLSCTTALPALSTSIHFLFDIPTMVDLRSEQDLAVSYTGHPRGGAPFVDAKGDGLHMSLTAPRELNGKGAVCYHFRFACLQQLACFGWRARHQRGAIVIPYIHIHRGSRPSFQSDMLLATVERAFCSIHTFTFPLPLMDTDSCTRLEPHLVVS